MYIILTINSRDNMEWRQAPLAGWRTTGNKRRAVRSLDSAHEECVGLASPQGRMERGLALAAAGFPGLPWHMPQPETNEHSSSTHSMLWHWIWGGHKQGKDLTIGRRGDPIPGRSLGGEAVAIGGVYTSNASAGAQISDGSCSTTAHPLI